MLSSNLPTRERKGKAAAAAGRMAAMQIGAFPCLTFQEPLSDLSVPVKLGTLSVYEWTLESW